MASYSGNPCTVRTLERNRLAVLLEHVCYIWEIPECEISVGFLNVQVTSPYGAVELSRSEWKALGLSSPSGWKTIALYIAGITAVCSLLVFSIRFLAKPIANQISLETEKKWFAFSDTEDKDLMLLLRKLKAPKVVSANLDLDDSSVNAFALPGAQIRVNQGLLCFTESPEELLGVLGHELGHIQQRHIVRGVIERSGTAILMLVLGAGSTADLANTAISNRFSVEDEAEADRIASKLMLDSGFSPDALAQFFKRLSSKDPNYFSKLEFLLSDHPLSQSRIDFFKAQSALLDEGATPSRHAIDKAWLSLRLKAGCK